MTTETKTAMKLICYPHTIETTVYKGVVYGIANEISVDMAPEEVDGFVNWQMKDRVTTRRVKRSLEEFTAARLNALPGQGITNLFGTTYAENFVYPDDMAVSRWERMMLRVLDVATDKIAIDTKNREQTLAKRRSAMIAKSLPPGFWTKKSTEKVAPWSAANAYLKTLGMKFVPEQIIPAHMISISRD